MRSGVVLLTETFSVGVGRDAVVECGLHNFPGSKHFALPVVLRGPGTVDLNGIDGCDSAAAGPAARRGITPKGAGAFGSGRAARDGRGAPTAAPRTASRRTISFAVCTFAFELARPLWRV